MYLSNIEVFGFKSFAQKTHIAFNAGMTAIVGPNGCGKTNVVDALRWVLGEQKASTLRSDKMYDVIFNGTKNRRALGLAEVSLTLKNNRGALPIEYTEVTVTRRLFRSGESQYLLNNTECRLRDITDLFMDTGLGPDAYSVIELKMIETILSERADERRRLFEEAAGVTKYKARRKEAERKLESVQADLARINDIVQEVENAVRALSRQAAKAKLAAEIGSTLHAVERVVWQHEYAQVLRLVHPVEQKITAGRTAKEQYEQEMNEAEGRTIHRLEAVQADVLQRLQHAERAVAEAHRHSTLAAQERAVANEQRAALERQRERALREADELSASTEQTEIRLAEARRQLDENDAELADAEEQYAMLKTAADESSLELQTARTTVRTTNEALMQTLNRVNTARAQSERTSVSIAALKQRVQETTSAMRQQNEKLDALRREYAQAEERAVKYQTNIQDREQELHQAQQSLETVQTELSAAEQESAAVQAKIGGTKAALDFLQGLVNTADTAEFLMNTSEWQPAQRTILAEALRVEERFRVAVESALGEAAQYLVVQRRTEAEAAIDTLKTASKGKATFICLDSVPPAPAPALLQSTIETLFHFGFASECIGINPNQIGEEHENALRSALRHVLNGIVITETAEAAHEIVAGGFAEGAVSLDGEVVRRSGTLRGGGKNPSEGATIGKTEHIESLKKTMNGLQRRLQHIRNTIHDKTALRKTLQLNSFSDALRQAETVQLKHEQSMAQIRFTMQSLEDSREQKQEDIQRFTVEIHALESDQAAQGSDRDSNLDALFAEQTAIEDNVQQAQATLTHLENDFSERTSVMREAEMHLVELRGEQRSLTGTVQRLEQDIESLQQRIEQRLAEADGAGTEQQMLNQRFAALEHTLETTANDARIAESLRDAALEEQAHVRQELQRETDRVRGIRRACEAVVAELHKAELERSALQNRVQTYRERGIHEFAQEMQDMNNDMNNDMNTIESDVLEHDAATANAALFDDGKFDIGRLKSEAKSLKEQIKSIGTVNPLAAEEYDRENERLQFLEAQLQDLQESEHTLKQTIHEINQTAQKQFFDVFERIRTSFIHIFKTLFNEGDEADLQIEEGDPLSAPIKIIAKPRGKRPASIEMLSGGEKTLTAIALLFAIYLVKPSPFCILDEVDAPLDDANISRYVNLIRKFSETTQFIMITHNKLTMEAAETLYGVTMAEEGVSKIVSVQFMEYEGDGKFATNGQHPKADAQRLEVS
jgi:chromosome segregation protein